MKRSRVSIILATVLAGAVAVAMATPAAADPKPQTRDIVGVGSDTSEHALNFLADGALSGGTFRAGINGAANARLVSFDATGSSTIILKTGTVAVNRPNGSTPGKAALFGGGNNTNVNFARSSSSLSGAEVSAGLWQVPFALDGLKPAVATTSNAPASLTPAQVLGIYNGTFTNWSQVGGTSGVIQPLIPFAGSGTRNFFQAQLNAINGGVTVTLGSNVVEVQEHDPAPIQGNANAIAPFSTGRFASVTGLKLTTGWSAQRALYNVVRTADLTAPWFAGTFGVDGFICGGGAKRLIEAAGFQQLAVPLDGGACGEPVQAAVTNFTLS